MREYLNDVTSLPKKCDELNSVIVAASGHDKMKFIDPRRGVAGDLGFETWIGQEFKPTFNVEAVGTLDETKFYSIVVVPVDRAVVSGADFQRGTPTLPSMPQQPTAVSKSLVFDIPVHTQQITHEVGTDTAGTAGFITDTSKAWTDDQWVDYSVQNVETGEVHAITANTATVITATGATPASGDRYSVIEDKATARDIFALEMSTETGIGGTYIYQGTVDDNSTLLYDLVTYIATGDSPPLSNVPPEPFAYCRSADNRVFAGGGTEENRGKARAFAHTEVIHCDNTWDIEWDGFATENGTTTLTDKGSKWIADQFAGKSVFNDNTAILGLVISNTREVLTIDTNLNTTAGDAFRVGAAVAGTRTITVSIESDLYSGAGSGRVARYTMSNDLGVADEIYVGSFVTITDALGGSLGNNTADAKVIAVASDKSWFEIINNTAVAATESALRVEIFTNAIIGQTSGVDKTYFTKGLVSGTISFEGEQSYLIDAIDEVLQLIVMSPRYDGDTIVNSNFEIQTDYELFWSDFGDPHVWRSENSAQIADRIMALEVIGGLLLIFCSRSLWKIPLNNLQQNATLVDDGINFIAPHSVVLTPRGVMFHDGVGFSVTDGQQVVSITQYKATDTMRSLNPDMTYNIRGEYDTANRRVEYVFPVGSDITNNSGLYITIDSQNIYPFTRMDCNVIWEDEDENGRAIMMHGTSGRHVASGAGSVYKRPFDQATDGDFGASSTMGVVTAVNADHLVVDFDSAMTLTEGTYAMFYPDPAVGGTIVQFIVENVTNSAGNTYELYFTDDWYSDGFVVGGTVHMTMIPFDYGIKWVDFGSPQHSHKIRQIQMDVTDCNGIIMVDHYANLNGTAPIQMDSEVMSSGRTKVIVTIKKGSYYTYGFRIRGYSSSKMKIHSYEILFDTEL